VTAIWIAALAAAVAASGDALDVGAALYGEVPAVDARGAAGAGVMASLGRAALLGPVGAEIEGRVGLGESLLFAGRAGARLPGPDSGPLRPALVAGVGIDVRGGASLRYDLGLGVDAAIDARRPRLARVQLRYAQSLPSASIDSALRMAVVDVGLRRAPRVTPRPAAPPPPEPVAEVVSATLVVESPPEETLIFVPHPVCQWLPLEDARPLLERLQPGEGVRVTAPDHVPVDVIIEAHTLFHDPVAHRAAAAEVPVTATTGAGVAAAAGGEGVVAAGADGAAVEAAATAEGVDASTGEGAATGADAAEAALVAVAVAAAETPARPLQVITLAPAPPQGAVVVMASPGDHVLIDEHTLLTDADGVAVLSAPEGDVEVRVTGGGREEVLQAAIGDGYAVWVRVPPPPDVYRVLFPIGSSALLPAARAQIEALAERVGDYDLRLRGSTSPEGFDGFNAELGIARAEAVRDHLLESGVAPGQLLVDTARSRDGSFEEMRNCTIEPLPPGVAP
jgi:hypothetical protein